MLRLVGSSCSLLRRGLGKHGGVGIIFLTLHSDAIVVFLQRNLTKLLRRISCKHVFNSVVLSNPSKLGRILEFFAIKCVRYPLKAVNNHIEQPKRSIEEVWFLSNRFVKHFALLLHCQWFIRTTKVDNLIQPTLVLNAVHEVLGQFRLSDGITPGHFSISKHDKRSPFLDNFKLTRYRFEKCCWTNNTPSHRILCLQVAFKLQFCLLKLQPRVFYAECTQKHKMSSVGGATSIQAILCRLVVNCVCIFLNSRAGCQTGDDGFNSAVFCCDVLKSLGKFFRIRHVALHDFGTFEELAV
mmetsp:Transcript_30487/g.87019  ORF Transcript_30487/g.87019 Transcript_30487/m.87019 type:complete len:297 (+) Transcript_30487:179-1069(+)